MTRQETIDLDAYLTRVGYKGGLGTTADTLIALHRAHATSIPFENLDVLLGRPIRLDLDSLQAKLVRDRRGGYCFEQNTLFAAALERLGFAVTRLAARVRWGGPRITARLHLLLKVEAEGTSYLADVGFGGWGLLEPVELTADRETRQGHWTYRLSRETDLWVLQTPQPADGGKSAWQDMYAFTLEPMHPVDFEVANHYTATHPQSRFTQTITAQLPTPEVRYILRNREFIVARPDSHSTSMVDGDADLLRVLAETFGLEFPANTTFNVRRP